MPSPGVAGNGCEQHLGPRCQGLLSATGIDLLDGPKQPPKGAGVVVHTDGADGRQRYRTRMAVTYPNGVAAVPPFLVPKPEAVTAAALPLRLREADPAPCPAAGARGSVGGEGAPEIDRGLLEYLGGDLMPPDEPCHLLRDRSISRHGENAAGIFTSLPSIECVNEIKTRPR
jgi:hypothetical protein